MNKKIEETNYQKFLSHFPGHVIQYFTDDKQKTENKVALTSTSFDLKQTNQMEERGCGVFFSINGFSNGRRTKENLTNINAIYVDIDVTKEQENLREEDLIEKKTIAYKQVKKSPLAPHFVTETKNGYHLIWLVDDIQTESDFIFIVKSLTEHFQADKAGTAVNKVLRLPGFLHQKNPNKPFLCRLLQDNSETIPKYKKADIIKKFSIEEETIIPKSANEKSTPSKQIQKATQIPIENVIKQSARIAGINIDFQYNHDGSKQIIENGVETSGFISSRGDFVSSSSGNERKGDQLSVAKYYLNEIGGNDYNAQEIAKILIEEPSITTSSAPIEEFSACDYSGLIKMDLPKIEFVIDELMAKNSLNLIVGDPGSFKTWIYLYYIYCIVENKLVFGKYEVNPTNVLIINIDDSLSLTKERMERIGFSKDSTNKVYIWTKQDFKIVSNGNKSILDSLSAFVKENKIGLIAIDTLRLIHDGDENISGDMTEVMITLKDFAEEHNCAFVIVHHKRKSAGGFPGGNVQSASGSIAIMANIFLSLHIKKGIDGNIQITREKGKSSKNIEPFYISFQDEQKQEELFKIVDRPNPKIDRAKIEELLKKSFDDTPKPEMTKKAFIDVFLEKLPDNIQTSKKSTNDAYNRLVDEKYIKADGVKRPHNAIYYIKNEDYEF